MSQGGNQAGGDLLTRRQMALAAAVFGLLFFGLWALGRLLLSANRLHGWQIDCPANFPLSMLELRLPGLRAPLWPLGVAAAMLLIFALLTWKLRRVTSGLLAILLVGFALVLGTNLIHGPDYGLRYPQQGPPNYRQYYHDAVQVTSVLEFLGEFERRQPGLGCHSRTHPPGAVLFFHALAKTVKYPAAISVAIAALSVGLLGGFFYGIIRREFSRPTCRYATLLLLLVPSVQIYCCASLDAVIAGCFLGVVFFFGHPNRRIAAIGAIICLFCASLLTFAACFLAPVMIGVEIITRRTVRRSAAILLGTTVLYILLYVFTGLNYAGSFAVASALENPGGFLLLAEPANYLFTRLEDACEILVFFGPFLLVLFAGGVGTMWRGRPRRELLAWTLLGAGTLVAMFLSGAFRTGETGRACLFIVPYLMFPVAAQIDRGRPRHYERQVLLWLVFGQTLVMQTFGGYVW